MLVLIVVCVVFGLLMWLRRTRYTNEPPALPGALPFIGHVHLSFGTKLKDLVNWCLYESQKCGGVVSFYVGPQPLYVVTDPDDYMTVSNTCLGKDVKYDLLKPWAEDGLINGTVSVWRNHRKLLNPSFNQKVLEGYLDVFNKQARRLVRDLEIEIGKKSFDHYTYIKRNALQTICLTAFGTDFNRRNELNSQYLLAVDELLNVITDRIYTFWLHNDFIYSWTKLKKKQDECLKIVHTMSDTILQETKKEYLSNKNKITENAKESKHTTFARILLELSLQKGAINDREIKDEVNTMVAAGYETTATALMYTVLMIGSHPMVQQKVFQELDEVFGDDDRDVTKHDLSRLIYLEAVLKETLRFHSIVPAVSRHLDKDVKLRNCTLYKEHACVLYIHGVHRNPMWGPDVEEFKPERWLEPDSLPTSSGAFAGFSMGKRNCIGKTYALMSLKTKLAHIFRNYKVQGDHTKMELKFAIVMKPVSGHHVSIQKRNNDKFI